MPLCWERARPDHDPISPDHLTDRKTDDAAASLALSWLLHDHSRCHDRAWCAGTFFTAYLTPPSVSFADQRTVLASSATMRHSHPWLIVSRRRLPQCQLVCATLTPRNGARSNNSVSGRSRAAQLLSAHPTASGRSPSFVAPPLRQLIVDLKADYPAFSLREIAQICFVQFGRRPSQHTIKQALADGPAPSHKGRRFPRYREMADPFEGRRTIITLHVAGVDPSLHR